MQLLRRFECFVACYMVEPFLMIHFDIKTLR